MNTFNWIETDLKLSEFSRMLNRKYEEQMFWIYEKDDMVKVKVDRKHGIIFHRTSERSVLLTVENVIRDLIRKEQSVKIKGIFYVNKRTNKKLPNTKTSPCNRKY